MTGTTVIFLGAFNPPTFAHLKIIYAAMNAVKADRGVFLPEPFFLVQRTIKGDKKDVMSNKLRRDLLNAFCVQYDNLSVDSFFMDNIKNKDISPRMWGELKKRYPHQCVFLLSEQSRPFILSKQSDKDAMIERFGFVLMQKKPHILQKAIEKIEWVRQHASSFAAFDLPEGLESIDSASVRIGLRAGDEAFIPAVGEAGWKILWDYGWIGRRRIDYFRGENHFLSNFYPAEIDYDGLHYLNSEAAYQAQKCACIAERTCFCTLSALEAKQLGSWVMLREDWNEVSVQVMREILMAKFTQHPELKERLLATKDSVLVEGNTWGDCFWGVDMRTGEGENHLGCLLMETRELLRHRGSLFEI